MKDKTSDEIIEGLNRDVDSVLEETRGKTVPDTVIISPAMVRAICKLYGIDNPCKEVDFED